VTLRALARGSILVTVANLVPRAGTFLLLPIYARFLTQSDFGVVSLAGSAALLLAITYRLGLDAALLRMHFDVEGADRRNLYATLAALSLACVAGASLVGILLALVVTGSGAGGPLIIWLLALGIAAANTFQFVPSVWLRATDQPGRYLTLAIAAFAAVVTVTVALVVVVRLGAVGSLAGQLAGATVMAGVATVLMLRMRPWRFRPAFARQALGFGLPLLPHTIAGWLLNLSDRWLLAILLALPAAQALAAVGVYSLGYQLGYAIGLAAVSFNAAWLPFLYRVGQRPNGPVVLREATSVVITGFAWMAAALAVLAPDLIRLIAPPEWAPAADVTTVVSFASALNAAGLMLASALYLHRDTRIVPLLTLAAVALNVAINLALIPAIGIMGAAWATVAAYGALALLTGLTARWRHRILLDLPRLALVGVMMVVPALLARTIGPEDPFLASGWHAALALAAALAAWALVREPLRRLRGHVAASGAAGGVG
jgi:O-antigen/teichoic acid export membrane protein